MTEGLPWSWLAVWLEGWFRGDVTAVSVVVTVDPLVITDVSFVITVDSLVVTSVLFVAGVRFVSCDSPGCGLINPRKRKRRWRIV